MIRSDGAGIHRDGAGSERSPGEIARRDHPQRMRGPR